MMSKKKASSYVKMRRRVSYFAMAILCGAAAITIFRASATSVFDELMHKTLNFGGCDANDFDGHGRQNVVCDNIEIPFIDNKRCGGCILVKNDLGRYSLLYDTAYVASRWVAYVLTAHDVQKGVERSNSFKSDSYLSSKNVATASNSDYKACGYDRGHLLPSGDRRLAEAENRATFILSNCLPQTPALNRGPWRLLEEQIRKLFPEWADTIYIVTGPVGLSRDCQRIGSNGVTVPKAFFKAYIVKKNGMLSGRGYIMPNSDTLTARVENCRITIDSLEKAIDEDLFYNLPDDIEAKVESE